MLNQWKIFTAVLFCVVTFTQSAQGQTTYSAPTGDLILDAFTGTYLLEDGLMTLPDGSTRHTSGFVMLDHDVTQPSFMRPGQYFGISSIDEFLGGGRVLGASNENVMALHIVGISWSPEVIEPSINLNCFKMAEDGKSVDVLASNEPCIRGANGPFSLFDVYGNGDFAIHGTLSVNSIDIPEGDLPITCQPPEVYRDTGGATVEKCDCIAVNQWMCLQGTLGPVD